MEQPNRGNNRRNWKTEEGIFEVIELSKHKELANHEKSREYEAREYLRYLMRKHYQPIPGRVLGNWGPGHNFILFLLLASSGQKEKLLRFSFNLGIRLALL